MSVAFDLQNGGELMKNPLSLEVDVLPYQSIAFSAENARVIDHGQQGVSAVYMKQRWQNINSLGSH